MAMDWQNLVPLVLGLITGILSAISVLKYEELSIPSIAPDPEYALGGTSFYLVSLLKKRDGERTRPVEDEVTNEDEIEAWLGPMRGSGVVNGHQQFLEEEVYREEALGLNPDLMKMASSPDFDTFWDAQRLKDKMKVLCMVAVAEGDVAIYGQVFQNTWTKHCTGIMVVSNRPVGVKGNIIREDLKPGWSHTWSRTKILLAEAHDRFVDDFDWFVKVPHDGYVVLENLRYLLLLHQASIPGYIGHVFEGSSEGGSTLVLSRYALELIVPSLSTCSPSYFQSADDGDNLETCFRKLDVISMMDGRDQEGTYRFQMKVPRLDLPRGATDRTQWNWRYTLHPERQGDDCCREYPITFHNVDIYEMYLLEYAVYHLRPFGIGNYSCPSSFPKIR